MRFFWGVLSGGVASLNHRNGFETCGLRGTLQSIDTSVFEGESRVFTSFGDSAQRLTWRVSLKRGVFQEDLPF
jgi:hypothetical protein